MKQSTLFACISLIVLVDTVVIFRIISSGQSIQVAATTSESAGYIQPSQMPTTLAEKIDSPTPISSESGTLSNIVTKELQGAQAKYALSIKNLKTGESYAMNEHISFEAASIYKLWVMATVYDQIEHNAFTESDQLSQDVSVLNKKFEIDSENAELKEGVVSYSVAEALEAMITISDNYAALLLSEKIGLSQVKSFLQDHHFSESIIGSSGQPPKTSASDAALFFEELYKGNLGSAESTKKMISLLKRQKLNNKIPKYLPESISVAHKTGELGAFSHDVGIVYLPEGDYIISVFSESNDPEGAEIRLSNISKSVYDYFTR